MPDGTSYIATAQSTEWETPFDKFQELDERYGPFDLDAAASRGQRIPELIRKRGGSYYIAPPEPGITGPVPRLARVSYDGLAMPWGGKVFLNPPYGSGMYQWIAKCVAEAAYNAERVVALVKATTDTRWWQEFVATEINREGNKMNDLLTHAHLVRGRLRFVGATGPAPFPSAIIIWEGNHGK